IANPAMPRRILVAGRRVVDEIGELGANAAW
ncbi:MAG: hypothetical protein QOG98_1441, partial [Pseudonocardiales bacterium]|nr:hypothetical protein [Pseudonocardiales bacterium]